MRNMQRAALTVALLAISCVVGGAPSIDIRNAFEDQSHAFVAALEQGAGFSFNYDGRPVDPKFANGWRRSSVDDAHTGSVATVLAHSSGLQVTRRTRVLRALGAVEYQLVFKNLSSRTLPPISALHPLNLSFGAPVAAGSCVISSGGGMSEGVLPPASFAIHERCFTPTVPDIGRVDLTTEGGRSSARDLPFFFIHNERSHEGLFVAFGWTGQWGAMVQQNVAAGELQVRGRIPKVDIALEPGEEIQGPTILVGAYRGALSAGTNRLRRVIREAYTPKLAGKAPLPASVYSSYFSVGVNFDESVLKRLADGAAAAGQEYFLIDAGWYASKSKGEFFSDGLGNWYQVDSRKFPNGLAPVIEYARAKGLAPGMWFEPERVTEGSQLATAHPEWILWRQGEDSDLVSWFRDTGPDNPYFQQAYGLLDYGRDDVQEWVRTMLDHYIREYGLKYIRYDFNMDPLGYWDAHDGPHRRGVTQLKHLRGLYSIVDWLRERHPDVRMEAVAAGGRRIDLETAKRFHAFWLSDQTVDPSIVRFHLSGVHYFLPGNYLNVAYVLPLAHQKHFDADDVEFQSLFAGALGFSSAFDRWSEDTKRKALLHSQTWRALRRYLIEDYYALGDQPGDLRSWSGWQFHDPRDQSGFVQTFRTNTSESRHRFMPQGLDASARYRFKDAYGAQSFEMTGADAMTKGIEMTQLPMSSRVLIYRRASE